MVLYAEDSGNNMTRRKSTHRHVKTKNFWLTDAKPEEGSVNYAESKITLSSSQTKKRQNNVPSNRKDKLTVEECQYSDDINQNVLEKNKSLQKSILPSEYAGNEVEDVIDALEDNLNEWPLSQGSIKLDNSELKSLKNKLDALSKQINKITNKKNFAAEEIGTKMQKSKNTRTSTLKLNNKIPSQKQSKLTFEGRQYSKDNGHSTLKTSKSLQKNILPSEHTGNENEEIENLLKDDTGDVDLTPSQKIMHNNLAKVDIPKTKPKLRNTSYKRKLRSQRNNINVISKKLPKTTNPNMCKSTRTSTLKRKSNVPSQIQNKLTVEEHQHSQHNSQNILANSKALQNNILSSEYADNETAEVENLLELDRNHIECMPSQKTTQENLKNVDIAEKNFNLRNESQGANKNIWNACKTFKHSVLIGENSDNKIDADEDSSQVDRNDIVCTPSQKSMIENHMYLEVPKKRLKLPTDFVQTDKSPGTDSPPTDQARRKSTHRHVKTKNFWLTDAKPEEGSVNYAESKITLSSSQTKKRQNNVPSNRKDKLTVEECQYSDDINQNVLEKNKSLQKSILPSEYAGNEVEDVIDALEDNLNEWPLSQGSIKLDLSNEDIPKRKHNSELKSLKNKLDALNKQINKITNKKNFAAEEIGTKMQKSKNTRTSTLKLNNKIPSQKQSKLTFEGRQYSKDNGHSTLKTSKSLQKNILPSEHTGNENEEIENLLKDDTGDVDLTPSQKIMHNNLAKVDIPKTKPKLRNTSYKRKLRSQRNNINVISKKLPKTTNPNMCKSTRTSTLKRKSNVPSQIQNKLTVEEHQHSQHNSQNILANSKALQNNILSSEYADNETAEVENLLELDRNNIECMPSQKTTQENLKNVDIAEKNFNLRNESQGANKNIWNACKTFKHSVLIGENSDNKIDADEDSSQVDRNDIVCTPSQKSMIENHMYLEVPKKRLKLPTDFVQTDKSPGTDSPPTDQARRKSTHRHVKTKNFWLTDAKPEEGSVNYAESKITLSSSQTKKRQNNVPSNRKDKLTVEECQYSDDINQNVLEKNKSLQKSILPSEYAGNEVEDVIDALEDNLNEWPLSQGSIKLDLSNEDIPKRKHNSELKSLKNKLDALNKQINKITNKKNFAAEEIGTKMQKSKNTRTSTLKLNNKIPSQKQSKLTFEGRQYSKDNGHSTLKTSKSLQKNILPSEHTGNENEEIENLLKDDTGDVDLTPSQKIMHNNLAKVDIPKTKPKLRNTSYKRKLRSQRNNINVISKKLPKTTNPNMCKSTRTSTLKRKSNVPSQIQNKLTVEEHQHSQHNSQNILANSKALQNNILSSEYADNETAEVENLLELDRNHIECMPSQKTTQENLKNVDIAEKNFNLRNESQGANKNIWNACKTFKHSVLIGENSDNKIDADEDSSQVDRNDIVCTPSQKSMIENHMYLEVPKKRLKLPTDFVQTDKSPGTDSPPTDQDHFGSFPFSFQSFEPISHFIIGASIRMNNFSSGFIEFKPNCQKWKNTAGKYDEFFFVLSGTAEVGINNSSKILRKGESFYMTHDDRFYIKNISCDKRLLLLFTRSKVK